MAIVNGNNSSMVRNSRCFLLQYIADIGDIGDIGDMYLCKHKTLIYQRSKIQQTV